METPNTQIKISELTRASAQRVVAKEFFPRCLLVILLEEIQATQHSHN